MSAIAIFAKQTLAELDTKFVWVAGLIGVFGVLFVKNIGVAAPFVVVLLLLVLLISWRQPEISLYCLLAYLPFAYALGNNFGRSTALFNLTNMLPLLVLGLAVRNQWGRGKLLFERTSITGAMVLFAGISLAMFARAGWLHGAGYLFEGWSDFKGEILPLGGYFLTLWLVHDRRTLKTVVTLIMVGVAMAAVIALWEYVGNAGSSFNWSRVGGVANHPNLMGAFFATYMFLFLGQFLLSWKSKLGWVWLLPFLAAVRGIMVTFSRGGYLACAVGVAAISWFYSKRLFGLLILVGFFAIANPKILPDGIRYRLEMTLEHSAAGVSSLPELLEKLEPSASKRLVIWQAAVDMVREHPLWGVGYGAFPRFLPHYTQGKIGFMNAHNSFLMIAAELGIPALIAFMWLLGSFFRNARWLYRKGQDPFLRAVGLGALGGLAGFVVAHSFTYCMRSPVVTGYFWILAGVVTRGMLLEREGEVVSSLDVGSRK